ncbi:hypothetical protein DBR40_11310 [Pedobacter sp. KBW01]|uniref:hypothetical protein n=1 Tax=Pedobacter sp. KBW01 TaxID=2153364 RepID=UPI000F5AA00F|nr:hypothetical protein [Pedobacter sp. KBW01]RQO76487.1 hypothetical protein DBR40_11310 [Pedobacter sp. KBW01]
MKNFKSLIGLLSIVAVSFTACKKNEGGNDSFANRSTSAADYSQSSLPVVAVSGDITSSVTWTAGNVYELSGVVTVRNGATLTIQAGTYIKASVNTAGVQNGVLVIAKDGTINAVGTAENPIVFTSRRLLDGDASTLGIPGDFGGVIILGNAKINVGDKLIEGLANEDKYHYGGNNDEDSRGTFQYVRIEYAGFQLAPNVEVNGLTLGGVGRGTTIDHVQVSYGLDDGFEFFGGTVSPNNLIALASDDDQFDFDNGFTGSLTDAVAIADKNSTHSTSGGSSDSNGIESDNNAPAEDGTFSLLPKTHPILQNVSVFGTENTSGIAGLGYRNGIRERRGSEISLIDVIVSGYPRGIVFDTDANASISDITNTSVHGFTSSITAAVGAYVDGGGNTLVVNGTNASYFGVSQPWYNTPGTPATVTLPGWAAGWSKLVY